MRHDGRFSITGPRTMNLLVGTSGFSYKEWKGVFYPEKLAATKMLGYYASQLPAVELNNTFYRMPKRETVAGWATQVPETFRFVLKASRRITHFGRLKNVEEPLEFFVENGRELGDRLGAALFQLPPNMKLDLERLETFLALLPEDLRAAFEFRHPSWRDDDVAALLRDHGAALVHDDVFDEDTPDGEAPEQLISTADWGYLRLRHEEYDAETVARWRQLVEAQSWSDAFVFFKHEDAGTGPRLAKTFLEAG